jgi:sarcosine oxidase subunit alpha
MVEAGLWYRPSYFPLEGETHWRQACDREVQMVRTGSWHLRCLDLGKN